MNIVDDLINFDTSFRYELGTNFLKSVVISSVSKITIIEW